MLLACILRLAVDLPCPLLRNTKRQSTDSNSYTQHTTNGTCPASEPFASTYSVGKHRQGSGRLRAHLDGSCLWVEICYQLVQGAKVCLNLLCQFSTWGLIFLHSEYLSLKLVLWCDEAHHCMHAMGSSLNPEQGVHGDFWSLLHEQVCVEIRASNAHSARRDCQGRETHIWRREVLPKYAVIYMACTDTSKQSNHTCQHCTESCQQCCVEVACTHLLH